MQLKIKATNFEMTADIVAYLDEKVESLERLITDEAARVEVELGRTAGHSQQGDVWKAEIIVHQSGERLYAIAEKESVKAALDVAKDEMLQQLRKGKKKNTSLARKMAARLKKFARRGDIRSY